MRISSVVAVLALALSSVSAGVLQDIRNRRGCGNDVSNAEVQALEADFVQQLESIGLQKNVAIPSFAAVNIPVWFHVVNQGTGIANGDVPQSAIDAQINVLNDSFGGAYTFTLAGVSNHRAFFFFFFFFFPFFWCVKECGIRSRSFPNHVIYIIDVFLIQVTRTTNANWFTSAGPSSCKLEKKKNYDFIHRNTL
jgi:hypothetical protein